MIVHVKLPDIYLQTACPSSLDQGYTHMKLSSVFSQFELNRQTLLYWHSSLRSHLPTHCLPLFSRPELHTHVKLPSVFSQFEFNRQTLLYWHSSLRSHLPIHCLPLFSRPGIHTCETFLCILTNWPESKDIAVLTWNFPLYFHNLGWMNKHCHTGTHLYLSHLPSHCLPLFSRPGLHTHVKLPSVFSQCELNGQTLPYWHSSLSATKFIHYHINVINGDIWKKCFNYLKSGNVFFYMQ